MRLLKSESPELSWLDFYEAGVPPSAFFAMRVEEIVKLAESTQATEGHLDFTAEVCFIGLAAYFEAFCKDEFAAVINICPETLERFAANRECAFGISEVLHLCNGMSHRLGSMVSEHYDFGSASSINGLFLDLLKISPFSKDESREYAEFLNDRNLLVHHGGTYTFKYAGQKFAKEQVAGIAHWQSLVVGKRDVERTAEYLLDLAKKIAGAAKAALTDFSKGQQIPVGEERKKAIDSLDYFG
jgi:hypothetical protein